MQDLAFATQIVGSWTKPHWLADHELVYGEEGTWWRVGPQQLNEAHDDAVRLAVSDQSTAGLTYVTDGEQRRQTFSGHFYRMNGIDVADRGEAVSKAIDIMSSITMKTRPIPAPTLSAGGEASGDSAAPPRPRQLQPKVTGPISWAGPILENEIRFLRSITTSPIKVTVIGPVTLGLRLVDEHYGNLDTMTFAVADALNQELLSLQALGVDLIQIDEPEVHFRYSAVAGYAVEAIDRCLRGVTTRKAIHVCYGYSKNIAEKRESPVYAAALRLLAETSTDEVSLEYEQPGHRPELLTNLAGKAVILGVLNLDTEAEVESTDHIVQRVSEATEVVGPAQMRLASDCGMWFLPRATANAKIRSMTQAAKILRGRHC